MRETKNIGDKVSFKHNKSAKIMLQRAMMGDLKSVLLQGPSGTGKTTMLR